MNLVKFAKEVHQNAIEHGWWDPNPPIGENFALIHSEFSEALEEYRAGRPLAYIEAHTGSQRDPEITLIERDKDGRYISPWGKQYTGKPEGQAVELLDACIRILDLLGRYEYRFYNTTVQEMVNKTRAANPELKKAVSLPELIAVLHSTTAKVGDACMFAVNRLKVVDLQSMRPALSRLEAVMGLVFCWVQMQGLDPAALMQEKHEFNITRPYKHGKLC